MNGAVEFIVPAGALVQAVNAVAPWQDPKNTFADAWNRYRLVVTDSRAYVLATDGRGAALAAVPVIATSTASSLPSVVDLDPGQVAKILAVFKPRKRRADDVAADGEELTIRVDRTVDVATGEAANEVTITETGGLWEGQTYTTPLPVVAEDFPRVIRALATHLNTGTPVPATPVAHLPAVTLDKLAKTAKAYDDRVLLERVSVNDRAGAFVARVGAWCLVLLSEWRGDPDEQQDIADQRAHLAALLDCLVDAEVPRNDPDATPSLLAAALDAIDDPAAFARVMEATAKDAEQTEQDPQPTPTTPRRLRAVPTTPKD